MPRVVPVRRETHNEEGKLSRVGSTHGLSALADDSAPSPGAPMRRAASRRSSLTPEGTKEDVAAMLPLVPSAVGVRWSDEVAGNTSYPGSGHASPAAASPKLPRALNGRPAAAAPKAAAGGGGGGGGGGPSSSTAELRSSAPAALGQPMHPRRLTRQASAGEEYWARRGDIAAEVGAQQRTKVGVQLIKATAHEIELDVPEDKSAALPPSRRASAA